MAEISARYACRHFLSEQVPRDKLACVLEAGRLAPSGFGVEPWRFLVALQEPMRTRIAEACFNQPPAATAPALIVISAQAGLLHPESGHVHRQLTLEAGGSDPAPLVQAYRAFHLSTDIAQWAIGQCQIAAAFMMLEATHQHLASCPIGGFDEAALRKAVDLPVDEMPALVLAVGRCADKQGTRMRRPFEDVVQYV